MFWWIFRGKCSKNTKIGVICIICCPLKLIYVLGAVQMIRNYLVGFCDPPPLHVINCNNLERPPPSQNGYIGIIWQHKSILDGNFMRILLDKFCEWHRALKLQWFFLKGLFKKSILYILLRFFWCNSSPHLPPSVNCNQL